ncbi:MAG: large repetitive protein, partial [Actinomycetota bacterium]|nr:large repetitive protein [Actinomycetota bacterium]
MQRPDATNPRRRVAAVAAMSIAALLLGAPGAGASVKPLKVRPEALRLATATVPFSQSLTATGGAAPYTFTVQSGSLPEGMALSSSGELTGAPTAAATSTFTVLATDSSS